MKLLDDRVSHDLQLTEAEWAAWRKWIVLVTSSSSSGKRRKTKKRRKRRHPRGVRIRRCGRPLVRSVPFPLSTGLRCSASWPVCTRRTFPRFSSFMAVAYALLVWLVPMHLALCSLLTSLGVCARLVSLVILHFALYFSLLSSDPYARHHCRYWNRWTVTWRDSGQHGAHGPDCIKLRKFHCCSSLRSSTFPSRRRGRFPRSCRTTEFPLWRVDTVVDVPVCRSCRFFVAVCVKTVEIPQCSSSYVVIPVVAQMQIPLVRFPQ